MYTIQSTQLGTRLHSRLSGVTFFIVLESFSSAGSVYNVIVEFVYNAGVGVTDVKSYHKQEEHAEESTAAVCTLHISTAHMQVAHVCSVGVHACSM